MVFEGAVNVPVVQCCSERYVRISYVEVLMAKWVSLVLLVLLFCGRSEGRMGCAVQVVLQQRRDAVKQFADVPAAQEGHDTAEPMQVQAAICARRRSPKKCCARKTVEHELY